MVGGAALAAAGTTPAGAASSCAAAGSKTFRSTPYARIYYTRAGRPYSCYRLTGRRVRLDIQVDRFYAPGDAHLGLTRITKRMLGYTWIDPGLPAVYVHSVDMRTARFKHRLRVEPRVIIDPAAVSVPQIVVNAVGSIAWIQRVEGFYRVWRWDRRGKVALGGPDTTERITALRLRGIRLSWRRAGRLVTASLI